MDTFPSLDVVQMTLRYAKKNHNIYTQITQQQRPKGVIKIQLMPSEGGGGCMCEACDFIV